MKALKQMLQLLLLFMLCLGTDSLAASHATKKHEVVKRSRKKKQLQQNKLMRSASFRYLTGITPGGINPCKNRLRANDYQALAKLNSFYQAALPLLFPITNKELRRQRKDRPSNGTRIPKILHFIWIGPNPFPKTSIKNVESWKTLHPDWDIYFWTDSQERELPIPSMKRRLIHNFSFGKVASLIEKTKNWGEKSDLMRYVILQKMGGIYVDHDVLCIKNFDAFATHIDLLVCLERPVHHEGLNGSIHPCNGLIGSRPGHPVFAQTIRRITQVWDRVQAEHPSTSSKDERERVLKRTYDSLARSIMSGQRFDKKRRDLILPSTYFYSVKVFDAKTRARLQSLGFIYAIHQYAGTWKPPA